MKKIFLISLLCLFLTSCGKPIMNKILTYDCLQGEFQEFLVEKINSCDICSNLNNVSYLE